MFAQAARPHVGPHVGNEGEAVRARSAAAGVPPTQVAKWAGHSVDVLLRIYAKCIDGQDETAKRRITEALCEDTARPQCDPEAGNDQIDDGRQS